MIETFIALILISSVLVGTQVRKISTKEKEETGECLRVKKYSKPWEKDIIYYYTTYIVEKHKMYMIYNKENQVACVGAQIFESCFVKI